MTDQDTASCFVCDKHRLADEAIGGVLYEDELVYAGHAYPLRSSLAYRGYLVAEPKRHVPDLGDLTDDEAAALGRLVNRLARALKEVAGAEHVYSFVLGHGVTHLHVVLAPRYPGTPREYWGFRLRDWPEAPRVDEAGVRTLVTRLHEHVVGGFDPNSSAMTTTNRPPAGYHSVTPRIVVVDVTAQVRFLQTVFDGVGDVQPGRPAEILIGDALIMVSPATERDAFPAFLYVYVDDADERYERALAAGARSVEAPLDTPYGDRRAMVRDPFGNVFQIAHRRSAG